MHWYRPGDIGDSTVVLFKVPAIILLHGSVLVDYDFLILYGEVDIVSPQSSRWLILSGPSYHLLQSLVQRWRVACRGSERSEPFPYLDPRERSSNSSHTQ